MTAPEEITVTANGIAFGALAWGRPDAPLALLVHGYPDTAWGWRHVGPRLAERGWRAVAPFTRGYGPTELAPDGRYRVADLAQDLIALRDALGGDDRAILVGHDWGAVATYAVTEAAPSCFRRYVTLSVPPTRALLGALTGRGGLRLALRQNRLSWYFLYNQLPVRATLDRNLPYLWRTWSPGYDASDDMPRVLAALNTPDRRTAALRYYRDNQRTGIVAAFSTRPQAPILYLHGEDDGCMTPEIGTRFPDALPPGSRYERLPDVGHFLPLEAPDRVTDLIADWAGAPTA